MLLSSSKLYIDFIGPKSDLSKIRTDLDPPTCDQCKQAPATLFHMFWTCPRLYNFWQSIFENISKILEGLVDPSPFIAMFAGVATQDVPLNSYKSSMLAYCSLLTRSLILFKWKDPLPLRYGYWIINMYHLKLEKIRYSMTFYTIWQPFLTFVENMEADNISI